MSKISDDWKALKQQIGIFVGEANNLLKDYEDIDQAIDKAEKRGYEKGYNANKYDICKDCSYEEFINKCNEHYNYTTINLFLELNPSDKLVVRDVINALHRKGE